MGRLAKELADMFVWCMRNDNIELTKEDRVLAEKFANFMLEYDGVSECFKDFLDDIPADYNDDLPSHEKALRQETNKMLDIGRA